MVNLFKSISHKLNGLIWSLASTGFITLLLSILVVWTNFMVRLVVGLLILLVAYVFIYAAYKLWCLKRAIEQYFKLK